MVSGRERVRKGRLSAVEFAWRRIEVLPGPESTVPPRDRRWKTGPGRGISKEGGAV